MNAQTQDPLIQLSDSLAARTEAAARIVVAIDITGRGMRSGVLWRPDLVVASEQSLPKTMDAEVVSHGGVRTMATLAGRDPGTNVAILKLAHAIESSDIGLPNKTEPRLGALVLALSTDGAGGPTVRLGVVRGLGAAWHSRAGGLIDRRIALDLLISHREDGGPVIDAAGGLLGVSAAGVRGRALVIPSSTVERVIEPLLASGHLRRGWLGLALHPVAVPDTPREKTGQSRGLMVMGLASDGPGARAGVLAGDILLTLDGTATERPRRLVEKLGPESVGRQVELRIVRAGEIMTLSATILARKEE
jgi:S1-C subfamily serine protease